MRRAFSLFSFCASVAIGATSVAMAEIPELPHQGDPVAMETYRGILYRNYRNCDDIFDSQLPPAGVALRCTHFYLLLKLSFLNDVTLESYLRMEASARAKTNRDGYDAYFAWRNARFEDVN